MRPFGWKARALSYPDRPGAGAKRLPDPRRRTRLDRSARYAFDDPIRRMTDSWIPRHLTAVLRSAAAEFPVVSVTGPRQSGKTTLLRRHFPDHAHVSLEDPLERAEALEDPRGFLARFPGPLVLDEAQHAPALFSYLLLAVDDDPSPGRFVLAGSQNFLRMPKITQSLAGRVRVTRLMPFSRAELARSPTRSTADLLSGPADAPAAETLAEHWTEEALRGFYPPIHDRGVTPANWLASHFQTYLQCDVRDLTRVGDLDAFARFARLTAGRAGGLLDLTALGDDCGARHDTVRRWLGVLETGFVVFRLFPYHRNFGKRLTKRPKIYFTDTGLLCWLLGIRSADTLRHHPLRGAVFENFVVAEVLKNEYHTGEVPRLHFFRDHRGNEVDLIVETDGATHAVEIKSGQTATTDMLRGLRYWASLTAEDSPRLLVYGGSADAIRSGIPVRSWRNWPR